MRTILLLIGTAALLGGCATARDIYASEADAKEETPATLADVSACLQLKYETAPITTPDGKQSFLLKNNYGSTLMMLTLSTIPTGTMVEMRRANTIQLMGNWRSCLHPEG